MAQPIAMSTAVELPPPDAWAVEASSLPLAFAQVREDPRLDMELARKLPPGATVVMIASGGDTAVCLGRLPLRLHLVDMNPAQLALARLKWDLAGSVPADRAAELLGHLPMAPEQRRRALGEILERLALREDVFGPASMVATAGPDHCGRYEITFAELRARLAPWRAAVDGLLSSADPLDAGMGAAMDAAFAEVMSLQNLVCLFGHEATQNPRRSFGEHFAWRTRDLIGRPAPRSNPFLWQILAGRFHPDHHYDWLQIGGPCGRPLVAEARWHTGKMKEMLDSLREESTDLIHLSNILDWLSPDEAQATLLAARRVLRPGGRVILRQLNSTLEITALDVGLNWDDRLGRAMEARDRSYFYPGIHIGSRP